VPGSQKEQLWGGAGGAANDYQLDGVSMNHPGTGGDFLGLSIDWIEALDVRGGVAAHPREHQVGLVLTLAQQRFDPLEDFDRDQPEYAAAVEGEDLLRAGPFHAVCEGHR